MSSCRRPESQPDSRRQNVAGNSQHQGDVPDDIMHRVYCLPVLADVLIRIIDKRLVPAVVVESTDVHLSLLKSVSRPCCLSF